MSLKYNFLSFKIDPSLASREIKTCTAASYNFKLGARD
jgi:hypothetical protein